MSDAALFAGPVLRRLRKRQQLTQAAMAARLQISPSYLNLIERNQRPVTARVVMQLAAEFGFDPREMQEDGSVGGIDGLARRFADERFADLAIDRDEVDELLSSVPQIAAAFARLYDSADPAARHGGDDPLVVSRREIERWRNHFADLDHSAEQLADEIRLSRGDVLGAITERLRYKHQLSVRILPRDVMPDSLRRLDLHARQIQLSELLSPESRVFQLALQIGLIEQRDAIASLVAGAEMYDEAGRELFARHLANYFAAALIMPYSRFLRACDATGYDLSVLQRRFGVSFEQLAHRLTTLQRVGQRGLPFFMARLDRAGQISKRFVGASGAVFLESEAVCPLWQATAAFGRRGELLVQNILVDDAGSGTAQWMTFAKAISGATGNADSLFTVVLGVDASLASDLASARWVASGRDEAMPIGLGCRRCHIVDCSQRAYPPAGRRLSFDRTKRLSVPFEFADSR
ncbi:ImmA/IrrE family metallo-endopeptidase [Porphyrobacter algicida]|uniref:ImmA/IrrE family metallo-endopeptidase n=1 Tax=Qipengyuania algicida TaxID=1836209 RepID=A0A845AJ67_9SPHN|nr:XRE family transcriptional regulator [Qipengyuania algicida]MXP28596.1 ImmA/IrrE family metallo-endopeptidase [Qipengyuania algicida]